MLPQFHHQIRNINQLEDLGLTVKIRMNQCLTKQILKTLNQLNHKKTSIIDGLGVDRVVKEIKTTENFMDVTDLTGILISLVSM